MGIRTGKGDTGFTDLLFQKGISKDSPDMRAIGDLEELNSFLGLVKVKMKGRKDKEMIEKIQRTVHVIASEIAVGSKKKKKSGPLLSSMDTDWIEGLIYELETKTDIKSHFYLPGDSELTALINIARTVTRRAERSVVELFRKEREKNRHILSYLNCLSDVLFIMVRKKAKQKSKKRKTGVKSRKRRKQRGG